MAVNIPPPEEMKMGVDLSSNWDNRIYMLATGLHDKTKKGTGSDFAKSEGQ